MPLPLGFPHLRALPFPPLSPQGHPHKTRPQGSTFLNRLRISRNSASGLRSGGSTPAPQRSQGRGGTGAAICPHQSACSGRGLDSTRPKERSPVGAQECPETTSCFARADLLQRGGTMFFHHTRGETETENTKATCMVTQVGSPPMVAICLASLHAENWHPGHAQVPGAPLPGQSHLAIARSQPPSLLCPCGDSCSVPVSPSPGTKLPCPAPATSTEEQPSAEAQPSSNPS